MYLYTFLNFTPKRGLNSSKHYLVFYPLYFKLRHFFNLHLAMIILPNINLNGSFFFSHTNSFVTGDFYKKYIILLQLLLFIYIHELAVYHRTHIFFIVTIICFTAKTFFHDVRVRNIQRNSTEINIIFKKQKNDGIISLGFVIRK